MWDLEEASATQSIFVGYASLGDTKPIKPVSTVSQEECAFEGATILRVSFGNFFLSANNDRELSVLRPGKFHLCPAAHLSSERDITTDVGHAAPENRKSIGVIS